MKVYAVLPWYDYEGYLKPLGIFTTLAVATECGEKHVSSYDGVDVVGYDLDAEVTLSDAFIMVIKPTK
jgi:hypothetical protein